MLLIALLLISQLYSAANSQSIIIEKTDVRLEIANTDSSYTLKLIYTDGQKESLTGSLGKTLDHNNVEICPDAENCLLFGTTRLEVNADIQSGFTLTWTNLDTNSVLQDCYDLKSTSTSWFGGPERWEQLWPLENLQLTNYPNVPQKENNGAFTEPYWLNTLGSYIFVDPITPLFIDQNSVAADAVCFSAKVEKPYFGRSNVTLKYTIVAQANAKEAHLHAAKNFLGTPAGYPNYHVIEHPIWSTWARYKQDISDDIIKTFADEIVSFGYTGQFEIDDDWETCYGSHTFKTEEFSDITNSISYIKNLGFTTSLWVHPFINANCLEETGIPHEYLVHTVDGDNRTSWWNSGENGAHHIDFTNSAAQDWYYNSLNGIKERHGIDSFKFDAGEINWAPEIAVLNASIDLSPNAITARYVETCARFGDLIEVRAGYQTQHVPVLMRMIDKDSRWGLNNGLQSLITTLLQMNMNGYSWVLPDMVGGNGYGEKPTAELFVRWLQANVFMPNIQFSYVPWDFTEPSIDVISISETYVNLHRSFAPEIQRAMEARVSTGTPVNAPLWWLDPEDAATYKINDQYLLGENIIVAPMVEEGGTQRDIYLPQGLWVDGNTGDLLDGGQLITEYPVDINILPYFVRYNSSAAEIWRTTMNNV